MATIADLDQMRADIAREISNLREEVSEISSIHSNASADHLALRGEIAGAKGSGGRTALIVCVVFIVLLIVAIAIGAAVFTSRNAAIAADSPNISVDKVDVRAHKVDVHQNAPPAPARVAIQQPQVASQRTGRKLNTLSVGDGPHLEKTRRPPAHRLAQQRPQAPKPVTAQRAGPAAGSRRFKSSAHLIDPSRMTAGPMMKKTRLAQRIPLAPLKQGQANSRTKMTQENLKKMLAAGNRVDPIFTNNVHPYEKGAGNHAFFRPGNKAIYEQQQRIARELISGKRHVGPGGLSDMVSVVAAAGPEAFGCVR